MHYTRSCLPFSAASGLPWTVISNLSIPTFKAKRQIYAWVGAHFQDSGKFNASYEIVLKAGATEGSAVTVATIPQASMMNGAGSASGVGYWDNFSCHDAGDKSLMAVRRGGDNTLRLCFNYGSVSGSFYANAVDISPICIDAINADWAQLKITALDYPSIGAGSNQLVCFLGVASQDVVR